MEENIFIVTLIRDTPKRLPVRVFFTFSGYSEVCFRHFTNFSCVYTFIIIIIKITTELLEYFAGGDVFVIRFSCIFYKNKIKIYKMYNFFHVSSEKKISTTVVTNKIDTNTYLFSSFSSTEAHTHTRPILVVQLRYKCTFQFFEQENKVLLLLLRYYSDIF